MSAGLDLFCDLLLLIKAVCAAQEWSRKHAVLWVRVECWSQCSPTAPVAPTPLCHRVKHLFERNRDHQITRSPDSCPEGGWGGGG